MNDLFSITESKEDEKQIMQIILALSEGEG